MAVAEVIARGEALRLRLGFENGDGILVSAEDPAGLTAGSIVALESVGKSSARVARQEDGTPLVVASCETALADIYKIAFRAEVRAGGLVEIDADVDEVLSDPRINDQDLLDLTALPFVTIDYEKSRDLDQAIYIEAFDETGKGSGNFRVYYALADAATYVLPSQALFREALERGTSFYLPGLTIPMLPAALSEGLISLNPNVDRRAFVFVIDLDASGEVRGYEIQHARIHSQGKLTYDGVQAFIDNPSASELADRPYSESLRLLAQVGELRICEARRRDVIRFDRVATELRLPSPQSARLSATIETRNDAQKWNEQISLLTNTLGAQFLLSKVDDATGLAGLFRVHPKPAPKELDAFAESVDEWVNELGLEPTWRWRRGKESLATYVHRLPSDAKNVRLARALKRQAMIMGRPSAFSTEAAPHFGVGADAYSRFSSPMREIVGIVTMHIALQQIRGESLASAGISKELIEAAVASGNRANKLQKKLNREAGKLALGELFTDELSLDEDSRPVRTATVMGVSVKKIYLQLDDPPMDVKLYVPDQSTHLGSELKLINRFELRSADGKHRIRVGAPVKVRVAEYASGRDRWILRLFQSAA